MPDTIKEYLAALGFKVDEPSYRKFSDVLALVSKRTGELGEVLVGTAGAIGLMVEKVAAKYNDLYYSSQRTGAAVKNIQALEAGFTKIGLTAEGARGLIEGFADALTNPGKTGLLDFLKVPEGDPAQRLISLVQRLNELFPGDKQRFIRQNYAQQFGIDNVSLRNVEQNLGKLQTAIGEFQAKQAEAGTNADDAAKKFQGFWDKLKDLEQAFVRLGDRIATSFVKPVESAVEAMTKLVDAFTKFNEEQGGAPGVVATVAGTAAGSWVLTRLIKRLFGRGAAATAAAGVEAGTGAAAGAGVGEVGAAASAIIPKILGKMFGVVGALLLDSTATGDRPDLYRRNPDTGEIEPTAELFRQMRLSERKLSKSRNLSDEALVGIDVRDAPPVRVQQTTTINIAPGPNAEETGRVVAKSQDRVNGDLVRNLKGALQ